MQQTLIADAVFDQLPFPAFIFDDASTVIAANRAAARFLKRDPPGLTGRSCAELLHCRHCGEECGMARALRSPSMVDEHPIFVTTDSGQQHLALVRASQLNDAGGRVRGVLALFSRIVEQSSHVPEPIIAESKIMNQVLDFARRVAASEATTVLLEGESGTGKELVARLLHHDSRRSSQPFVAINCAAMPETLLESELFGYEKGAFTDARTQKSGLFDLAEGGTLFLDEIAELPLKLQAKLLRVLDDHTFRRLGGLRDIPFDFRIVAATNRNLTLAVAQGLFRLDLFYRLNVVQVKLPPLRERREDILPLARHFIDQLSRKFRRNPAALPEETARLLFTFDWPGNVRELRSVMERGLLFDDSDGLSAESLPHEFHEGTNRSVVRASNLLPLISLKESEASLIAQAMSQTGGNQSKAARLLGVSRDTLRCRLKKQVADALRSAVSTAEDESAC